MRVFIHAFQGRPWNEECLAAYNGFKKLGAECVLFTTNEELDKRKQEDVVVGGTLIMSHALNQNGISSNVDTYPGELSDYMGRKIWSTTISELRKESLPLFIKPVEDKAANGIVVRSWEDAAEYELFPPDFKVLCSEVVKFVSEWRCFVRYGKIVGIRCYNGDWRTMCDHKTIKRAVSAYKSIPAGCSLDFGVTDDGRTILIEVNDGIALGCYGLKDTEYAKLLSARWAELNKTQDRFDNTGEEYAEEHKKNLAEAENSQAMTWTETDLIKAHEYCRNHMAALKRDKVCGCFYCRKIYAPSEITEWLIAKDDSNKCDRYGTAICPYCGIDSVIGESSGYPITEAFLTAMEKRWFG